MKTLSILLIIGATIMGIFDGGDMTAVLVLAVLLCPVIFERKECVKGEKGNYFAHTLNNTVVAPPRMLIAFLENNYNPDGSINIPEALRSYMGGIDKIVPKN